VSLIDVQDLTKTFKVRQRSAGTGTGAALRRLLRPGWELREAVSHVSFTIGEGEIVMVRRLARVAGVDSADTLSPHSFRHAFVTAVLDAGVSLRDVQDAAGHADPRTTRRYDRSRHSLDRHATYAVAAWLAGGA